MTQRKTARDVFWENPPALMPRTTWEEAYPDLESATVTVRETGFGRHLGPWERTLEYPPGFDRFVGCNNPRCQRGGFVVQDLISDLYSQGATEGESEPKKCLGREGPPNRRPEPYPCMHMFKASAVLAYKGEKSASRSPDD